jgi:hypothetical protein
MINLLPDNEKANVAREYKLRRLAVFLICLIIIGVLTVIFLAPSYVLSIYKGRTMVVKVNQPSLDDIARQKNFQNQINSAKVYLGILTPSPDKMYPSDIIELLINDKTNANSITNINYTRPDANTILVQVSGISASRQSLSSYTEALAKKPGIIKVDVPVANFIQDTNIAFSFTITAKNL